MKKYNSVFLSIFIFKVLCPFVEEKEMERAADEEEAEQQRRRAEEEAFRMVARQPEERRKQGQEQARIACYPQEQALHQCYETKWFPMITCYEENNAFWDCFKEKRVRMRSPHLSLHSNSKNGARCEINRDPFSHPGIFEIEA